MFVNLLRLSLWTGAIILLLLLFFRVVRGRYAAGLKYWIWLLLAVRLLIPVTVTLPEQVNQVPAVRAVAETQLEIRRSVTAISPQIEAWDNAEVQTAATETAAPSVQTAAVQNDGAEAPKRTVSPMTVLTWVWAIGAVLFLTYHWLVNFAFRRHVRRWSWPARSRPLKELVLRAKRNCGLRRSFRLLIMEDVGSPMVVGYFHPMLVLPREEWDATELYYVLRHELTHLKRRDMLYKGLLLLCNAVHWFNPAVWVMRFRAYQDLEITCDMTVVEGATRDVRMLYCETIMATAQRSAGLGMAATFGSTKKSIMERFREIFSEARKKRGTAVFAVVLVIAVLAGCSLTLTGLAETEARPETDQMQAVAVSEAAETSAEEPETVVLENGVIIPAYGQEWIREGEGDVLFTCQNGGKTLFSVLRMEYSYLAANYAWQINTYYDNWPTEALEGWDYMLGRNGEQNDLYYVIRVSGDTPLENSQQLLADIMRLNGITPNPCLIAEPYYRGEDAEAAIAHVIETADPEIVAQKVLEKIKGGTNSAGADDEILEAFAEFLGKFWWEYMDIAGDEYLWSVEYDEQDRLTLKVIREEPIETEVYYKTYWYQDGQVVFGQSMGYFAEYEPPNAGDMLAEAEAKLRTAEGYGSASQETLEAMAQWITDAIVFLEQYGAWSWSLASDTLTCTGPVSDSGVIPFVRLSFDAATGQITSTSGSSAKSAAAANTGCIRYQPEQRPGDMAEYMVHESDLTDGFGVSFHMDMIDVLALLGTPEFLHDDEGEGFVSLTYESASYTFAHCGACEAYHLLVFSQTGADDSRNLMGLSVGDSLEEVLERFQASGAEASANTRLYDYDSTHYATFSPVADTGLECIMVFADRVWCELSFNRASQLMRISVMYE